ncbi:PE-PPE domain-containing protein [Thermocrispum municipale]|uniref:PE-PPE domain-containing protein n=1 Tax=Thermocrispum municipale TaxID=37926 RepID=UPI0003FB5A3F|nr:PE-PPE domain-containing protein [Thermocrispum municipale]
MKRKLLAGLAAAAAVALLVGTSASAVAEPANQQGARYFVLIGGTCDPNADAYNDIDLRGGVPLRVHYPAAGNPACSQLGISYDASVAEGHRAARAVLEQAYANDPGGEFVVVGFSQGAHVANLVLEDVADGRIGVPKSQVSGSLYGDPMHPGTGIGAIVPKGMSAFGFTSPGPGRTDFGGIPVERYCIETDGVCHFNTIEAPGGYVIQHPCYPSKVMPETLADHVVHGNHWWPRVGPC